MELNMMKAVRVGIDSDVQPISLRIEVNHNFIDRNVIRSSTVGRL